jgi:plastocyanin
MIPAGVRFWLAVTAFGVGAAVGYGLSTEDLVGTFVLSSLAAAAFMIALFLVGVYDGTVAPMPVEPGGEPVPLPPPPVPPTAPAAWPLVGALAGGITLVGLVAGPFLAFVGVGAAVLVAIEWMVQGWAEHATPDPVENRTLRNRVMFPFEIPVIAVLGAGGAVLLFSRVLLALPKTGSTVIAIAVAILILAGGTLVATRPRITSGLLTGLIGLAGVALIGGGIAGAVAGERDIEPHEAHDVQAGREVVVVARDIAFDVTEIEAHSGEHLTVVLENEDDGTQHNIAFTGLDGPPATDIAAGPDTQELELTAPEPGDYEYVCQVHPTDMQGTLVVTAAEE